ncbi:hypothetical protein [uncultured Roseobacter sp.]|uniref:hypothetical protein n=1 Tax=uncultured Roseobacter sp. TaxID=114847 RepID=UPI0026173057|nr:hypothetical protein [uncultured Roseobacter sp.]
MLRIAFLAAATAMPLSAPAHAHHSGLYEYRAKIVRVYDADAVWANIDLGFNVTLNNQPLRLHRVDTPEVIRNHVVDAVRINYAAYTPFSSFNRLLVAKLSLE